MEAWAGPTIEGFETASFGRGRTITIPLVVPATRKFAMVVRWETPNEWLALTVNALKYYVTRCALSLNYLWERSKVCRSCFVCAW